jgi:hypothetical protein
MALKACPDTLQLTFSYLDPRSLALCTPNKYWKTIAYQEKLWKAIAERDYVGITADFQKTCREIKSNRHTAITLHQAIETYFQRATFKTNSIFRCFFDDGSRLSIRIKVHPLAPYSLTMNCSAPADSFGRSARQISAFSPEGFLTPVQFVETDMMSLRTFDDEGTKIMLSMNGMKSHNRYETGKGFIDTLLVKKCKEISEASEEKKFYQLIGLLALTTTVCTICIISVDPAYAQTTTGCCATVMMVIAVAFPILSNMKLKFNHDYPG